MILDRWLLPKIDHVGPDQWLEGKRLFREVRILLRLYAIRPVGTTYPHLKLYFGWERYFLTPAIQFLIKEHLIEVSIVKMPRHSPKKLYYLTKKGFYIAESLMKQATWNSTFVETIDP